MSRSHRTEPRQADLRRVGSRARRAGPGSAVPGRVAPRRGGSGRVGPRRARPASGSDAPHRTAPRRATSGRTARVGPYRPRPAVPGGAALGGAVLCRVVSGRGGSELEVRHELPQVLGPAAAPFAAPTPCVVAAVASATTAMFAAIFSAPVAASATERLISAVVADCSSTAEAIVAWYWFHVAHPADRLGRDARVGLDRRHAPADVLGRLRRLLRQVLDLAGHDGEALARLPRAGRLDCRVERQEVGLLGD